MVNARTKLAAAALATVVAVGATGVLAPLADAQEDRTERREERRQNREERRQNREERRQNREERLQQMVDDGTITQERADEIRARHADRAAAREARRADRTERREALAATLGLTADELKAELRGGSSLAEIVDAAGVDPEVVIDQLVAAKADRLEQAVAAGRIDQAAADERLETIRERITNRFNG